MVRLADAVDILDAKRVPVNADERRLRPGVVPYYGATGQVGVIDDYLFNEELVLLGEDGAPFLDPSKSKAYEISGPSWVNNHAHVLRARAGLLNSYLAHQLNAIDYTPYVSGTTRLKLPQGAMKEIQIVVPSPEDQQKVVDRLEEQFSRLDAAIVALKRVQANLKRYRASVLKAACEGRLVRPCDPWKKTCLGEVIVRIDAGKSFKCTERPPVLGETGVAKVSAVTWGRYDENESKTCLETSRIEDRYLIREGDFLFSRANTIHLVGACVIVEATTKSVMLSDKTLRLAFSDDVTPKWVLIWLRSKIGRADIERLSTGNQLSMRNIGQDRLRQISLLIPPRAEQERIVTEVERLLSIVDQLESAITTNLNRAFRLRKSVLQVAFTGRRGAE